MALKIEIGACFKRNVNNSIECVLGELQDGGIDYIHLDIFDGQMVNDSPLGEREIHEIRKHCHVPLEAHLMEVNPRPMGYYKSLGIDRVLIHHEAHGSKEKMLYIARGNNLKGGIALKPSSPHDSSQALLPLLSDSILVMCTKSGSFGKIFDERAVMRVGQVRSLFRGHINVNSGVGVFLDQQLEESTVFRLAKAGASRFSIERGIFNLGVPINKAIELNRDAARYGRLCSDHSIPSCLAVTPAKSDENLVVNY